MKRFSLSLKSLMLTVAAGCMALLSSSCVHQFPEQDKNEGDVVLHVNHILEWLPDYEMNLSRAEEDGYNIRYDFKVYPKGNTKDLIKEFTIIKEDLRRPDFTTTLALMPGDYDIYVWSDYCYAKDDNPVFYDDSNFSAITYKEPYRGDTDLRDCFRGMTGVTVKDPGMHEWETVEATVVLQRPVARYKFIANDLADFIDKETTRGFLINSDPSIDTDNMQAPAGQRWARLADYVVKVSYPLYMPAVFDNFRNNPVDSWTGVSFTCTMEQLSDDDAQLAMDYTFVNGEESSVQVMIEIFDPTGMLIARTQTITVPTKRDRTTIVNGKFLTTLRNDGVGIDPDFEGSYNIEI